MNPPRLSDDLRQEKHSQECLSLEAGYYPEVAEIIRSVAENLRIQLQGRTLGRDLELTMMGLEGLTTNTEIYKHYPLNIFLAILNSLRIDIHCCPYLSGKKEQIWSPIARAYSQIVSILSEKITPLEKRELLRQGTEVEGELAFSESSLGIGFYVRPLHFRYALAYGSRREPLRSIYTPGNKRDEIIAGLGLKKYARGDERIFIPTRFFVIEMPGSGSTATVVMPDMERTRAALKEMFPDA